MCALDVAQYAYLLGQYLGDGHITEEDTPARSRSRIHRRIAGELKRYEYPRYLFINRSLDILPLCGTALDHLGIAYRRPHWDQVSVARREAVAALDVWVDPKT